MNTITLTIDPDTYAVQYEISCHNCAPFLIVEALHKIAIITTMQFHENSRPITEEIINAIYKTFLN